MTKFKPGKCCKTVHISMFKLSEPLKKKAKYSRQEELEKQQQVYW